MRAATTMIARDKLRLLISQASRGLLNADAYPRKKRATQSMLWEILHKSGLAQFPKP